MSRPVPEEAADLLAGARQMAHLATCRDDRPHVAPVWFRYDDGVVEVVTSGRKLANLRENPRAALSVEESVDGDATWKVTLLGTATVVDDPDATRETTRRINRKYGVDDDAWAENTLVRIDVGSATYRTYE